MVNTKNSSLLKILVCNHYPSGISGDHNIYGYQGSNIRSGYWQGNTDLIQLRIVKNPTIIDALAFLFHPEFF